MNSWLDWLKQTGPQVIADIVFAAVILIVGFILSGIARKIVIRLISQGKLKKEKMLISLAARSTRMSVIVLAAIMAMDKLGISIAPFIASLGVGGLVLGFAFKDTLSNFASGLLILIYRPFRIGNAVDIDGTMGTVIDLSIVNTTLQDFEGPVIFLPNSKVWGSKIINISRAKVRRAIFTIGIGYDDDLKNAWQVLWDLISEDDRILKEPGPFIRLSELADSSVNFQVFVYSSPGDYGSLLNDFYSRAKTKLVDAGISIPYPQTDVHLFQK